MKSLSVFQQNKSMKTIMLVCVMQGQRWLEVSAELQIFGSLT